MLLGQQALDLALGDRQADRLQQGGQTRQRGLALMVLHQHEATQVRTEMSFDPLWQRRDDRLAVRGDPTLAPVADRMHRQHQLLNQIGVVALEARASWRGGLHHPILDADTRADLAAAWLLLLQGGFGRVGAFVHATRLDVRPALQSLQPCDLLTLLGNHPLQFADFCQQTDHQFPQLGRRQAVKVVGRDHT